MNLKSKFDFRSIRFKLWVYFIGFAIVLIGLIWFLQIFFLNNFYQDMKIRETTNLADELVQYYNDENQDLTTLMQKIDALSFSNENDLYIRVETAAGGIVIPPTYGEHVQLYRYGLQIQELRAQLEISPLGKASILSKKEGSGTRIFSYARYLSKATDSFNEEENKARSYIIYIVSPLYPVKSTIAILRSQLIYITVIAALLALTLALYLASRISKPIKEITNSAAEMGKGHYGVKFKGGHYSEITELADTLTNASRELEKTDMYQKDLIANVSHDLRTPLTMIKSYAEMIRDLSGNNPPKREAHLGVIIDEADRLNTLVNDMLNMSKMQSRSIELERSNFDLKKTAETILASFEILAEKEGYHFKFNCSSSVIVNGDETKIKQVLSNLINNAVKYGGEDKEIIVNIKKSSRKVRCEIIDHGPGIAPDEINHVWERYYKSSTHHVRPTDGSGLGLSIVKEILTLHRANYGVNSKLGKGSTFWFEMETVKLKK